MTASQLSRDRDGEARTARRMTRVPDRIAAVTASPRYHAERNQQHVRDLLADRDPQYARALDRTVRDLSPRTRGRASRG